MVLLLSYYGLGMGDGPKHQRVLLIKHIFQAPEEPIPVRPFLRIPLPPRDGISGTEDAIRPRQRLLRCFTSRSLGAKGDDQAL